MNNDITSTQQKQTVTHFCVATQGLTTMWSQGRSQLFISGGQFSQNFIRLRFRVIQPWYNFFANGHT